MANSSIRCSIFVAKLTMIGLCTLATPRLHAFDEPSNHKHSIALDGVVNHEASKFLNKPRPDEPATSMTLSEICDEDLSTYLKSNKLRSLTIKSPLITDAGLEHLSKATNLERLALDCPNITSKGIAGISRLHQLKHLRIVGQHLDNVIVGSVAVLESLETLELPVVLDVSVQFDLPLGRLMADFPQFRGFGRVAQAKDSRINGDVFRRLAKLKHLKSLNLTGQPIDDDMLQVLSGLEMLEELNLCSTCISDEGLDSVARSKKLRVLSISANGITSRGIAQLV